MIRITTTCAVDHRPYGHENLRLRVQGVLSEEVGEFWFRDELLRGKVTGQPPGAAAISRFRREHRGLLKWIITQVFKHALRQHYELGDATIPPGLMRILRDAVAARIDISRHLDRSVQGEYTRLPKWKKGSPCG